MEDDFVTYDELSGPELDPVRWEPMRLPLPASGEHIAVDPNAEVTVADGEARVTIPRFSLSSDDFQPVDSLEYVTFSTSHFELPADRPATFAAEMAVENIGGQPSDYRRGLAAFQVADVEATRRVFSVTGTSTRVFAMHEHLPLGGGGPAEPDGGPAEPFIHVVESPYEDIDDDFTRLRACEITLDRSTSTATWLLDGSKLYEVRCTRIPERVRFAFAIYTQLPIRNGRSQSLEGQGLTGRWRGFRVRGVEV
jgi:hypothetical protein